MLNFQTSAIIHDIYFKFIAFLIFGFLKTTSRFLRNARGPNIENISTDSAYGETRTFRTSVILVHILKLQGVVQSDYYG